MRRLLSSAKRTQAKRKRAEAKVAKAVREKVSLRDGYCRIKLHKGFGFGFGLCDGTSEWAHLGEFKRFKTRGQTAERRHTVEGTLMLCSRHHYLYDQHHLKIEAVTPDGTEGPLRFSLRAEVYEELNGSIREWS